MNFIALSSQAKLRDRPHLDAEGVIDRALELAERARAAGRK